MIGYSIQGTSKRIGTDELHTELKNRNGKPIINIFISTSDVNSIVSVYSSGAYYQLYIEEYDIFIVYKRFGSFHPDVLKASVTKRVRNILSEGVNVKRKRVKKNDN